MIKLENKNRWWYEKVYQDLMESRKTRGLDKTKLSYYTEKHHIIPKCMGGNNDSENLVLLTMREHILAHYILTRIYPDNLGIVRASAAMLVKNKYRHNTSTRLAESIRENYTNHSKDFSREQLCKEFSDEHKANLSKAMKGKKLTEKTKQKLDKTRFKNRISAEGKIFDSISDCARYYGVSYQTIQFRLRKYTDKYFRLGSNRSKNIKVQGPDGTVYDSINQCAKSIGRHKSTIVRWIKNHPELGYKYV